MTVTAISTVHYSDREWYSITHTGNPRNPTPRDCKEVYQRGCTQDGVYTIDPGCMKPFQVYCDMRNGQWIVFQRRRNGQENFNRNWEEYKDGFGNLTWEFWLGNEKIHCLTFATCRAELRIDMGDNMGRKVHAIYDYFAIESERTKYKLRLGKYTGTAGDGMRVCGSSDSHDGMQFTTPDRDNDRSSTNCAQSFSAGWWHNRCYCSNLNTPYNHNGYMHGWHTFSGRLKCSEMKLRSRD